MIIRYTIAVLILIVFLIAFFLPTAPFKTPFYEKPNSQVKANNSYQASLVPIVNSNLSQPEPLTSKSAVVIDARTGIVLYEKNPDLKHLPASTTKLMTALTALEKCSLESIVTVDVLEREGTQMGLDLGDQVTIENLLYGMLINSGNDAATVLADSCAPSTREFINSMNQKAEDLGMENTRFANPTGFDNEFQFSTANDLAKLANVTIANPLISKIVATKSTVVTDVTGNKTYFLENINELLETVDGLVGVKTGQTEGSLENLITKTTRDSNSIIVVVLGSENRFEETERLIEWAFVAHKWTIL